LKLAEVGAKRPFLGVVLLGSFARDGADDLSDVDFVFFAAEGASSPRGSSDIVSTLLTPRAGTTRVRL
jgi:predicted nucleotidyltransferase